MTNFVQQYRSTDASAPVLSGQAGALIALLDAVLKDGYSTASITGITRSGTTATATLASANTTLVTGDYLTFGGANETDYNVTGPITVTDSTHVTYQVANSPATPATGTLTYKKAALGWTKPFTGTNLAAYLPQSVSGYPQFYLRIDETGGTAGGQKECAVRGFESMSDINTGTNGFPTSGQQASGLCWRKSTTADSTARAWTIFGNGRTFYLIVNSDASATVGRHINAFGGFESFKSGDAYNALITGSGTFNTGNPTAVNAGIGNIYTQTQTPTITSTYAARSYSQAGGSQPLIHFGEHINASSVNNTAIGSTVAGLLTYPNAPDNALWHDTPYLAETNATRRGRCSGLFGHQHSSIPLSEYDKSTNVNGLPGVTLTAVAIVAVAAAGQAYFDTFGPW